MQFWIFATALKIQILNKYILELRQYKECANISSFSEITNWPSSMVVDFLKGFKAVMMQKMFENEVVCHKTVHFGFGVIRAKNERRMIDDGLMIGNQLPICRVWQIDQIQLREALTATSDKYFEKINKYSNMKLRQICLNNLNKYI